MALFHAGPRWSVRARTVLAGLLAVVAVLVVATMAYASTITWYYGGASPGSFHQSTYYQPLTGTYTADNDGCNCHTVGAGASGSAMAYGIGQAFHGYSGGTYRYPQLQNATSIPLSLNAHFNY